MMGRQSQEGDSGSRKRRDADSIAPVGGPPHNPARKPDGGDDQGDGTRARHNDDKGEGRGVAGGGKNQGTKNKQK